MVDDKQNQKYDSDSDQHEDMSDKLQKISSWLLSAVTAKKTK
jgi:hypothetical protein